jgi:hypothetical protein
VSFAHLIIDFEILRKRLGNIILPSHSCQIEKLTGMLLACGFENMNNYSFDFLIEFGVIPYKGETAYV